MINLICDKKRFASLALIMLTFFTPLTSVFIVYRVPACNASETPKARANTAAPYGLKKGASLTSSPDADLNASYGKLPLSFTANQGQVNSSARFLAQGNGFNLSLKTSEAVLNLSKSTDVDTKSPEHLLVNPMLESAAPQASVQTTTLRMKMIGANPATKLEGVEQLPGLSNYFTGNDPAKWHTNVPNYAKVIQRNVYKGVDMVYYGKQENLEYDFIVAPGAKPEVITVEFAGAQKMRVGEQGDVVLTTPIGEVRQHSPVVYQEINGARREIAARIVVKGKHQVGFKVGAYDRTKPLVIDPVLSYSTFFGDKGSAGTKIAVDADGNAYFLRHEPSGSFQTKYSVTKLNATGSAMIYSSHFNTAVNSAGKLVGTMPVALAVDASGKAYITGQTDDPSFLTTPGAFQTSKPAGTCAFVSKLNSSGTLAYSTFLGGGSPGTLLGGTEAATAIAPDNLGNAYVTGHTPSTSFPVTPGAYLTTYPPLAPNAAFVTKLNPTGSGLVYSTFLGIGSVATGGGEGFIVYGVAVDSTGVYLTGLTDSPNLPVTANALQPALNADTVNHPGIDSSDAFAMKLNAAGSALVYCTYLGGSGHDAIRGAAVDSAGNFHIVGQTNSLNFPTTNAFQGTFAKGPYTRSTDQGVSWQTGGQGIVGSGVVRLAVSKNSPTVFAISSSGILYKSLDGGDTWNPVVTPPNPSSVRIDPRTSTIFLNTIDTNTQDYNVFKSLDGGNTWSGPILQDGQLSVIDSTTTASTMYANTGFLSLDNKSDLLKSIDGGATWTKIPVVNLDSVGVLAVAPNSPSTLYGNTLKNEVIWLSISTDGGINWTASNVKGGAGTIIVDPQSPSNVYAIHAIPDNDALGGEGRGNARKRSAQSGNPSNIGGYSVLKSINGGKTFDPMINGFKAAPHSLALDPNNPNTLYAGAGDGVYKSTDGSANWVRVFKTDSEVSALAVGPQSTVHIGTFAAYGGFVAKVNSTGTALLYSTYIGGSSSDIAMDIKLDDQGKAYIGGVTSSTGFPTTPDAQQATLQGGPDGFISDGFIMILNPAGNLLYSSFFGGTEPDGVDGVAVDPAGNNFYLVGHTYSANFPLKNALQPNFTGSATPGNYSSNTFVSKFSNSAAATTAKPKITGIEMAGKKLIVIGMNFKEGAVIVMNGQEQPTIVLDASQAFSKKAGKRFLANQPAQPAMFQVKNPNGDLSDPISYSRQ